MLKFIKLRKTICFFLVLSLSFNFSLTKNVSASDSHDAKLTSNSDELYHIEVNNEEEWYSKVYSALLNGHFNLRVKHYGKFSPRTYSRLVPDAWALDKLDKYDLQSTSSDSYYMYENASDFGSKDYKYTNKYVEYTLYFKFQESYDETKLVESMVESIIKSFGENFDKLTDYRKIETVHDWIIANVNYDYSLNDRTAYTALYNGQTVCAGYSTLFYKFMTELNIDCKIIRGYVNFNDDFTSNVVKLYRHAWNIVKLDNEWYNIDTTWGTDGTRNYFLKNIKSIVSHTYAPDYLEEWFLKKYKLASDDFILSFYGNQNSSIQFENSVYNVNVGDNVEAKYSLQNMIEYSKLKFTSMNDSIASVDNSGIIKGISAGKTTIKAQTNDERFSQSFEVNVVEPITKISGSTKTKKIPVGEKHSLELKAYPANNGSNLVYKSSNKNIKVSRNGTVTALKKGKSEITIYAASNPKVKTKMKIIIT